MTVGPSGGARHGCNQTVVADPASEPLARPCADADHGAGNPPLLISSGTNSSPRVEPPAAVAGGSPFPGWTARHFARTGVAGWAFLPWTISGQYFSNLYFGSLSVSWH